MKYIKYLLLFTLMFAGVYAFSAEGDTFVLEGGILDAILGFLLTKFPKISVVFMIMGGLRAIFKPLTLAIEAYVKYSPSTEDDVKWGRAKNSKVFKLVEKFLDYFASVKIPAKK